VCAGSAQAPLVFQRNYIRRLGAAGFPKELHSHKKNSHVNIFRWFPHSPWMRRMGWGIYYDRLAGLVHAWVGQMVTFFAYRPPSRPQGSLMPTQPGRVTNPTQGHPGPPWEAPQADESAGCSGVSPSHRPSAGSCHRARSGSTAGSGQRLPPCMHPRGTRRQL